jgi:ribulose-bisphosphate carboxylase large chain
MKYLDYIYIGYKPKRSDLICEFYVEPSGCDIQLAAGAIASESSIGTWTELTTMTKKIQKYAAKVFSIKKNYIKIAYPIELFETGNMPQILSSIAGNIFGMKLVKNLKLLDIEFPKQIIDKFRGPLYGIEGVRKILKIKERPLIGTIIKPKLGLNEKQHAKVAYSAWIGGCDIVKDDENLTSMNFNKFNTRIIETLRARNKAEKSSGEKKIYMPNITAPVSEMIKRAKFVKAHGGRYIMIDIVTCGWSALQELRKANQELKLVIHAHRAGYAALSRNPKHGISMLVIAKIARLIGVDQLHVGTIVGKMDTPKDEVVAIDQEMEKSFIKDHKLESKHMLEQRWYNIKPVFAVCSGGLNPTHVPYLIKHLGKNIIIQMGGGVHGHPMGTVCGARAARQALESSLRKISLAEYAKKHHELAVAIKKFK